jgi:hypothetical protein
VTPGKRSALIEAARNDRSAKWSTCYALPRASPDEILLQTANYSRWHSVNLRNPARTAKSSLQSIQRGNKKLELFPSLNVSTGLDGRTQTRGIGKAGVKAPKMSVR